MRSVPLAAVGFLLAISQATLDKAETKPSSPGPIEQLSLRWVAEPQKINKAVLEVCGLSPSVLQKLRESDWKLPCWQRLLAVYAEQGDLANDLSLPPMLGSYGVQSGVLRFMPGFPLEPGVTYRGWFQPNQLPGKGDSGDAFLTATYQVPPRRAEPTTLVSFVYPSAEILPENLLKFYLHFSAPMSRGHIYDHIHLLDQTGKELERPFLEIDEELWNPAMTRLTLFIDPGRIKRGVSPLEEVGPALEAGKRYRLVIDPSWKDGAGNPLKQSFQKVFSVGPPDRDPPDSTQWKIQPPKPETAEPLVVVFSEPMDRALAHRVIRVVEESGEPVPGKNTLENQERRWIFTPKIPWSRRLYKLEVQTILEDLAGNNIGKPFEVDLFEGVQRSLPASTVELPFEVR